MHNKLTDVLLATVLTNASHSMILIFLHPGGGRSSTPVRSSSPTPAASMSGLSPEQQAFMARKAAETGGSAASYSAPAPQRSSAPVASNAAGLSPEQQAFLARKAAEKGGSAASYSAPAAAPQRSSAAAPANGQFSADQLAFLARKRSEHGIGKSCISYIQCSTPAFVLATCTGHDCMADILSTVLMNGTFLHKHGSNEQYLLHCRCLQLCASTSQGSYSRCQHVWPERRPASVPGSQGG